MALAFKEESILPIKGIVVGILFKIFWMVVFILLAIVFRKWATFFKTYLARVFQMVLKRKRDKLQFPLEVTPFPSKDLKLLRKLERLEVVPGPMTKLRNFPTLFIKPFPEKRPVKILLRKPPIPEEEEGLLEDPEETAPLPLLLPPEVFPLLLPPPMVASTGTFFLKLSI